MKVKIIIALLFWSLLGVAQKASFTLSAPKAVELGQTFQLSYSVNQQGNSFQGPSSWPGFDYAGGPFTSSSSSTQIINGKMTSNVRLTYTYQLRAKQVGTFTIPAASIKINGKRIKSNTTSIQVVKGTANPNPPSNNNASTVQPGNDNLPKGLVFARTHVSKKSAYVGEPIVVSLKIYSEKRIKDIQDFKAPTYDGFWKEDIDIGQLKLEQEAYGDKVYYTVTLQKVILFPQTTGDLEIGDFSLKGVIGIIKTRKARDQWEYMMYGSQVRAEENTPVELNSPKVKIKVKPLPENGKPDDFQDISGKFTMQASIDKNKVEVNDAINLKVKISGEGNIDLLELPKPILPTDFESYEPKLSTQSDVSIAGVKGSKSAEYLIIPRNEGDFIIPPIRFSYFDVTKEKYVTLQSDTFRIRVGKGSGGNYPQVPSTSKTKAELLSQDIRFIKTKNSKFQRADYHLFNSLWHILSLVFMPLLLGLILFVLKRKYKNSLDTASNRNRKATRVAKRRLKLAAKYQTQGDAIAFYQEISHALWGYLSDKFTIPRSELSMENIEVKLQNRLEDELTSNVIKVLNDCEFARFAPGEQNTTMEQIYEETLQLIQNVENKIKS